MAITDARPWLASRGESPDQQGREIGNRGSAEYALWHSQSLEQGVNARARRDAGVNVTVIAQLPFAGICGPHPLCTAKSGSEEIALAILSGPLRLFISLAAFGALGTPTIMLPNAMLEGVSVICATPLPVSATVCVPIPALSLTVSDPVTGATTSGENVSEIVHFACAANVPTQLFVWANGPALCGILRFV